MTTARDWLAHRRPPPPDSLRHALAEALDRCPDGRDAAESVADRLADAGMSALGRVLAAPSTRASALELLAADALLTYACEAAAEADVGAVLRLTGRLDPSAFDRLLGREEE